jgi:hypothetical protein
MAAPPERVWAALVDIVPGERVVQAVDFVAEDVRDGISTEDHAAGLASSLCEPRRLRGAVALHER